MASLSAVSVPTANDSEKAAEALERLQPAFAARMTKGVRVIAQYVHTKGKSRGHSDKEEAELPPVATQLLRDILAYLANGTAVRILPLHAKLTTQQVADLLNVSRPHVVKLLETGKVKYEKVGTHRRVLVADVLQYQRKRAGETQNAADELTQEAERLGLGY